MYAPESWPDLTCPVKYMQDVIDKMNMKEICITFGQTGTSPATLMSKTTYCRTKG